MKILKNAYEVINELWGYQEKNEVEYKLSQYVYSMEDGSSVYMYHYLTGELLVLENNESLEENREYFIHNWFMVPKDLNEYEKAKELKKYSRENHNLLPGRNNYTIFTTTSCNARCFYCYEHGAKRETMTKDTADHVVEYMLRNKGEKPIYLTWFGGEPLVNASIIDYICEKLKSLGVEYSSDMHSNGYLFDEQNIEKASTLWKLKIVRITIDGLYEVYRKTKNYVNNDKNPLSKVLNNIDRLVEKGVHVQIRLHLDEYSYDDISKLVNLVCERYNHNPLIDSYIHLLFVRHEYNATNHSDETRVEFLNKIDVLEEKLVNSGLLKYDLRSKPIVFACRSDWENTLEVLPNGNIIKCRDYLDSVPVGNVKSDQLDNHLLQVWKERAQDSKECEDCMVYPECARLKMCLEKSVCDEPYRLEKIRKIRNSIKYTYMKNNTED